MDLEVPEVLRTDRNNLVLDFLKPQSCHGDIVEPLEQVLRPLPGVRWFCPDPPHFRYCCWYVGDTVFAFAVGMHHVSLRLPGTESAAALAAGAAICREAGDNWFSFNYNEPQLSRWAPIAYVYACNP